MIANWSFVKLFAFFFVHSPLFLKLTPAFIRPFHCFLVTIIARILAFSSVLFKHMPPYLADSTCFLVTISHLWPSLSYFHLPFETYATFPRLKHTFRINHFLLNVTTLYTSCNDNWLPNRLKLVNYSWIHTLSVVIIGHHRYWHHTSVLSYSLRGLKIF